MGHLYLLTFPNGKGYVGQTRKTIAERFYKHGWDAVNRPPGQHNAIHAAWRRHGAPTCTDLGVFPDDQLNTAEITLIASFGTKYPAGYNLTDGGDRNPALEPVVQAKIRAARSTPEAKAAVSRQHKGRVKSAKERENIRRGQIGRKLSAESIAKRTATRFARGGGKYMGGGAHVSP